MTSSGTTRLMAVLILGAAFLSGSLLGAALERKKSSEPEVVNETSESQGGDRDRRGRVVDEVGLTEAQNARVDSIVAWMRDERRALNREMNEAYGPRFRALVDSARTAIMDVLTPEQAEEYQRLLAEYDARRRAERDARDGEGEGEER